MTVSDRFVLHVSLQKAIRAALMAERQKTDKLSERVELQFEAEVTSCRFFTCTDMLAASLRTASDPVSIL